MDIEEVAAKTPERIMTLAINPASGLQPYQARQLAYNLGLNPAQVKQFVTLAQKLYRLFEECDAGLLEINPLIVDKSGDLVALVVLAPGESRRAHEQGQAEHRCERGARALQPSGLATLRAVAGTSI